MQTVTLTRYLHLQACNNAWANQRLLASCAALSQEGFTARRTNFFPSLRSTLNHNLAVDRYYLDALERGIRGEPPNASVDEFFGQHAMHQTCATLSDAQRTSDQKLIRFCQTLSDEQIAAPVLIPREARTCRETVWRVLAHLFQHQIHHRGQVHSMVSGTSIPPPQLDEFYLASDAPLRSAELDPLGLDAVALLEAQRP